jgi:hypothetical protein
LKCFFEDGQDGQVGGNGVSETASGKGSRRLSAR